MVTAKLQLLQDTFESKFDIDKFKTFTREFFNEPEMLSARRHTGIWKEYENNILSYSDIAKFKDAEGNKIVVFAVELKSEKGVERARSLQRNFVSKILNDNNCEAAIVAFYSSEDVNWRLSFVRLDYTFKEKGLELDLTPAKRYSYLVGENETSHTAQKQLYPIFEDDKHNPSLDEIEAAFSVEKVTKDFFEQYKNKYYDLKEYLEKDEAFINETSKLGFEVDRFSEQFAKKLMGQLAFLYFLQKKGWLGVRIMPEDHSIEKSKFMKIYNDADQIHKEILKKVFVQSKDESMKLSNRLFHSITDKEADLFSDCFIGSELNMSWGSGDKKFIRGIYDFCISSTNKNFFDDYLEPFFYDALNKRRENQYYKEFNCKIPFLNGGLFEPLEGYHWKESKFEIPNYIFSNVKEKGREADGILDIFDRYNFTMNEDEPLEKEVAVDPEMLGKIFENLLDGKDRKAKGAFYTPREIVHYMCQESLTNYLVNEVNVPYEDMKEFILYGELIRDADNRANVGYGKDFIIKQTIFDKIVQIDEALKNVRVADPAVGSGAFPLGMVNEIVRARNNITEYLVRLDKTNKLDRKYGEKYIRKIRSQYKMKWDTIKNSIFAVDIEPSAVDIAKLRLWLSVVVEQEIDDDNTEPHPLPNLDCNIMVGNSLIDEYEGIKLFDESILHRYKNSSSNGEARTHSQFAGAMQLSLLVDHSDDMLKEMFELQDRYFDEDEENKKKEIKAKIDKIRDDLIEYKLNHDGNSAAFKEYKEMKKLKMKPFFIWELEFAKVFRDKDGFDIVIGNPPYIQLQKFRGNFLQDAMKNQNFEVYDSKGDIYCLFYEKGIDLLKENGALCFITSNKWMRAGYGEKLRKYFVKFNPKILFDLGSNIFETATVDTNILLVEKSSNLKELKAVTVKDKSVNLNLYFSKNSVVIPDVCNDAWFIGDYITEALKQKFEGVGVPLEKWNLTIKCGFKTGLNEAFIISQEMYDDIVNKDERSKELIRKNLRGKDVRKYECNWAETWIIVAKYGFHKEIDKYPAIKEHLLNYETKLKNRGQCKYSRSNVESNDFNGQHHWLELDNNPKQDIINVFDSSEKILFPDIARDASFYYDTEKFYTQETCFAIVGINLKYILALLNSKLITFMYKNFYAGGGLGDSAIRYKKAFIEKLPILQPKEHEKNIIEHIAEQIITIKKSDSTADTSSLEAEIDKRVYELYSLTEYEIKTVEGK